MTNRNALHIVLFIGLCALLKATGTAAQDSFLARDIFSQPLSSGGTGPEMVVVRKGAFVFGGGRVGDNEEDVVIEFPHPFAISRTEITTGMYRHFLTATASADTRVVEGIKDDLPVHGVSWDEAEAFVSWLSHQTGYYYSLPSSSQWEYAARAGSKRLYSWGDALGEGNANCTDCGGELQGKLAPVGSFKPNSWNIFDMHGNVWEWTKDCMDRNSKPPANGMPKLFGNCDSRELRGGSFQGDGWSIRFNSRASGRRSDHIRDVGFRVVMAVPR